MLCLSTANIEVDKAKKKCSYPSPRKDPHLDNINCGLFAHPINQHVYWSGFDLGASSCPQAESWSANTVKASASAAAAAAAASTAAVAATKRIITESRGWSPEEQWREQMKIIMPVFGSKDAREGAVAFAEKRAPNWTGS